MNLADPNDVRGGPSFARLCTLATLAVLAANLAGLGAFPLLDVDEPRFVSASRHLLRGSEWIVPWFNGDERFDKPILVYWLQAACMAVFGPHEFGARLPSALSIAAVVPMVAASARTLGLRAPFAVLAGVAVATCGVAQALARGATADALLLAMVCITAKLQIDVFAGKGTWRTGFAAWIWGALAFLAKGPPAVVAPLALALGMIAAGHRPRVRTAILGFAIATWIVLAWAIPALIRTEGRFWTVGVMHHVVDRSLTAFEGHGGHAPWWYLFYLVAIPLAFLPWSPFLLKLRQLEQPIERRTARLLLVWFAVTFAVFTIATSKLAHYPLPGFPPLAIAAMFAVQRARASRGTDHAIAVILGAVGVLVAAASIALFPAMHLEFDGVVALTAATFLVGFGTAATFAWRGNIARAAAATAIAAIAGFAQVASGVVPSFFESGIQREVARAQAEVFPVGLQVATWQLSMPSLVFYLDRHIEMLDGDAARRALEVIVDPGAVLVLEQKRIHELHDALATATDLTPEQATRIRTALDSPRRVLRGFLTNKGKVVELAVIGA